MNLVWIIVIANELLNYIIYSCLKILLLVMPMAAHIVDSFDIILLNIPVLLWSIILLCVSKNIIFFLKKIWAVTTRKSTFIVLVVLNQVKHSLADQFCSNISIKSFAESFDLYFISSKEPPRTYTSTSPKS